MSGRGFWKAHYAVRKALERDPSLREDFVAAIEGIAADVVPRDRVDDRIERMEQALKWIDNELSAILNTWTFENDEGWALQVIRDKARAALNNAAS